MVEPNSDTNRVNHLIMYCDYMSSKLKRKPKTKIKKNEQTKNNLDIYLNTFYRK